MVVFERKTQDCSSPIPASQQRWLPHRLTSTPETDSSEGLVHWRIGEAQSDLEMGCVSGICWGHVFSHASKSRREEGSSPRVLLLHLPGITDRDAPDGADAVNAMFSQCIKPEPAGVAFATNRTIY
jgi:hypothetical protein